MESFIKWAGGKRWLVKNHETLFPKQNEFKKYVEPFLGGGSVYFNLEPKKAVLNDVNSELITTYKTIKENWVIIHEELERLHHIHNENLYYEIRDTNPTTDIEIATRFLYLNRTCWNGLYRVNKNNRFNVPIGTKNKVLLDSDNFGKASKLLQNADLHNLDFEKIISKARRDDFLFIDPPYTVKHNLNGFVKYNEKLFTWDDQIRLRNAVVKAINRNVKVLVLNADHESIRDLYNNIGDQFSLNRASVIAGNKEKRGIYSELAIKCY